MDPTVAVALGLGIFGLGLRLLKLPEHFAWGIISAGAIILASGLLPWWRPTGWQLILYVIGVAALASAAAWQVSDALKQAAEAKKAAEAASDAPAPKASGPPKVEGEPPSAEDKERHGDTIAKSIDKSLGKPSPQIVRKPVEALPAAKGTPAAPPSKRAFYRSQLQILYANTGEHLNAVASITADEKVPIAQAEIQALQQRAIDWIGANMGKAAVQKYLSPGFGSYAYDWPGEHSAEAQRTRDNLIDTLKSRMKNLEDLLSKDDWDPADPERPNG